MKKTLLFLGALTILGTTAFGATSIASEVRAIDYKDGTDKMEYTLAKGSTDIAENLKFSFDVDLDTEYNGSDRSKAWDTTFGLQYAVAEKVLDHDLTVGYYADYDAVEGSEDNGSLGHTVVFTFEKDNYSIEPMYVFYDDSSEGYFEIDLGISADGPLGTSLYLGSYSYFNVDGCEDLDTDLEIYLSKTVPFYGVNLKPLVGFEGYDLLTEDARDAAFLAQLRVDKTFKATESFALTPYAAYTHYKGSDAQSYDAKYYEFGIETSLKF